MRSWMLALLLLPGAKMRAQSTSADARAIVVSGLRAADAGNLPAWTAAWERRLRARPGDRASFLALGTSARITFRDDDAERWYAAVLQGDSSDALARHARVGTAIVAVAQGRYAEARTRTAAIERDAAAVPDSSIWLEALTLRAAVVSQTQGPVAAAAILDSSTRLRPARDPFLDLQVRCQRAQIASARGDRAAAHRDARAGADLARKLGATRAEAACLFVLVSEFVRSAATDSLAAIAPTLLARERQAGADDLLAITQQWLGWYLISLGRHQLARRALDEAWAAGQRSHAEPVMAWTSVAHATLALTFRDLGEAARWLGRADSLMTRVGDRNGTAQVLSRRATLAVFLGRRRDAIALADSALALSSTLGDPQSMLHLLELQRVLALRDDRADDAERLLGRERDLVRRHGMKGWETMLASSALEIELVRRRWAAADSLAVSMLASFHPSQHAARHDARVRLAIARLGRGDVDAAERDALAAADEFDAWRATLADAELRTLAAQAQDIDPSDHGITALIAGLAGAGRAARAFELAERRRARELGDRMMLAAAWRAPPAATTAAQPAVWADPRAVTAAGIVAAIPDSETAIVEYVTGPGVTPTTLFAATRRGVRAYRLPPIDSIAPLVQRFQGEIEAGRDGALNGVSLGRQLLAPMLDDLPAHIRRLVLVPDGALHRLPFDALRLPDAHYVVERFETVVAPSATIAARLWSTPPPAARATSGTRLLAFGDPRFAAERDARDDASRALPGGGEGGLPRLPASADEVKKVARFASRADVLLRDRASESRLKQTPLQGYDVLHFATHALVDEWSVAHTALALTPGQGEDGFVEPAEIAALDLRARLVVLSGCRTAGGEIVGGEGVRGLVTPFLHAGARSVVATQWAIGDRSVITFIERFYAALATGESVATALWRTKRALLAAGATPREWSVFTVVGDPYVRIPLKSR